MLTVQQLELIQQHLWLPNTIYSKRLRFGRWLLPKDDLIGAGYLALVQSSKRYSDDGRAKFATYASHRVHGAMLDADRLERHAYRVATTPTDLLADGAVPSPPPDIGETTARRQRAHQVRELLQRLPARHRMLLYMHFWEDVPLQDVAQALKVTPSRVSQLKREAFEQLRPLLAGVA